ncbi:MAG: GvpL/GvpF family gas vesicle protein [Candidatus Riflebacteria bacterium]|nr:GvpL/GvpF family gas vesicle protein [Candidatus Riflebacteria bacterium]
MGVTQRDTSKRKAKAGPAIAAPLLYLYGVAARVTKPRESGRFERCATDRTDPEASPWLLASGVEEQVPVEAVDHGTVLAIVSRVPAADYEEEPLAGHLRNLSWVMERASRHNQVLVDLGARMTILPCRFCTLFRHEDALRHASSERMTAIGKMLKRVAGRAEWAVKVYAVRPVEKKSTTSASGAQYFTSLARERAAERSAGQRARASIDTIVQSILEVTQEVVPLELRQIADGPTSDLILNLACLVDRHQETALKRVLGDLTARGPELCIALTFSGPLPPYSFVKDPLS